MYIFNIFLFDKHLKCIRKKKFVTHFQQHISMAIFSGKRYFNDILLAQACNNNTLLLAAIRYKKKRSKVIKR